METQIYIEYRGTWVHNPVEDLKDFNYAGSVTFTNVSGSTAAYKLAGTAIAVFGEFEEAGTFAMHSAYSIDGGPAVDFIPASTIVRPSYRQKFFQVDNLPDGEHTLVITDVGNEFWLDYLWINQASQSQSQSQELPSSSASPSPPPNATPSPISTVYPEIHRSVTSVGLSSLTKITQSFASTDNATPRKPQH